jgi:cysteine synthase B
MIVESMKELIGKTPLLRIPASFHGLPNVEVYAKLELLNPFGSVKDRTAWALIEDEIDGIAAGKKTIFENSSGNTAKALQAIAGLYGVKVRLVTGLSRVQEQKDLIYHLGGDVEEFATANDCFDPNDPNDPQFLIQKAANENPGAIFFPSQFTNDKNTKVHYRTTGEELLQDLGAVDYFFGGLGTTGSSLGIAKRLREAMPDSQCVGIVPKKHNFIPGIRSMDQMWESGLFERRNYEAFVEVGERESLEMMLRLNRELALLGGPSTGANMLGLIRHMKTVVPTLTKPVKAVFIACDRVEWYLSYLKQRMPEVYAEPAKPDSLCQFEFDDGSPLYVVEASEIENLTTQPHTRIIDIRSPVAFKAARIPGSINIPEAIFESLIDSGEPFPDDEAILLVCAVGDKTRRLAAFMRRKGCTAFSLDGGMREYSLRKSGNNSSNLWL